MAEKYPELELYEKEQMAELIVRLRQEPDALFPPPATEKELAECYDYLKHLVLPHPLPPDFLAFYAESIVFSWNKNL
jgi:hypothetical protein